MSNKDTLSKKINESYEGNYKFEEVNNKFEEINIGHNILKIQENDRQRIARDLHDSSVQSLTGMLHKLELCTKLIDKDSIRAKLELIAMKDTLRVVINEMRDIIYDLKPMSLDDLGLVLSVKRLAEKIMSETGVRVNICHNKEIHGNASLINITLYRVIQEACINAVKHSLATVIDINITYDKEDIKVLIKDNGVGFNVEGQYEKESSLTTGFGLSIMKERINLLSGTLIIQSTEEDGTIIDICVPLSILQGGRKRH